jgi:hypothetical protein
MSDWQRYVELDKELTEYDIDEVAFAVDQEITDMGRGGLMQYAMLGMMIEKMSQSKAELIESGWITEQEEQDESIK